MQTIKKAAQYPPWLLIRCFIRCYLQGRENTSTKIVCPAAAVLSSADCVRYASRIHKRHWKRGVSADYEHYSRLVYRYKYIYAYICNLYEMKPRESLIQPPAPHTRCSNRAGVRWWNTNILAEQFGSEKQVTGDNISKTYWPANTTRAHIIALVGMMVRICGRRALSLTYVSMPLCKRGKGDDQHLVRVLHFFRPFAHRADISIHLSPGTWIWGRARFCVLQYIYLYMHLCFRMLLV